MIHTLTPLEPLGRGRGGACAADAVRMEELLPDGTAIVLYNVLSPAECRHYMSQASEMGLEELDLDSRVAGRCVGTSHEVASIMFERCAHFLDDIDVPGASPPSKDRECPPELKGIPVDTRAGKWCPSGLNERFRLCRYRPGGYFLPHYDYAFVRSTDERSFKTFMVYLNDSSEYDGGPTNFFKDSQDHYVEPDPANIVKSFRPRQGCALMFNSNITHDGGKLRSGTKWIMRSEVMYRHRRPQVPRDVGAANGRPGAQGPAAQTKLCLVLDIDGTMLSHQASSPSDMLLPGYLRPGLREFLRHAFAHCGAVGIWTAAGREWADAFVSAVDAAVQEKLPWAFVWSGERVSRSCLREGIALSCYEPQRRTKRLCKVWRNKRCRSVGFTRDTTLIVDDTPSMCADNFGNSLYVQEWWGEPDDDVLVMLPHFLGQLSSELEAHPEALRHREKRGWYVSTKHRLAQSVLPSAPAPAVLQPRIGVGTVLRAQVGYIGTAFLGWQHQGEETEARCAKSSVQATVELALHRALNHTGDRVVTHAVSRTDAGTHARMQILQFTVPPPQPQPPHPHPHPHPPLPSSELRTNHEPRSDGAATLYHNDCAALALSWNQHLPDAVRINDLTVAPPACHPRRLTSKRKTYHYYIQQGARQPDTHPYSWYRPQQLNIDLMRQALALFEGTHDFSNYGTASSGGSTVRTILAARLDVLTPEVAASEFTTHLPGSPPAPTIPAPGTPATTASYCANDVCLEQASVGDYCAACALELGVQASSSRGIGTVGAGCAAQELAQEAANAPEEVRYLRVALTGDGFLKHMVRRIVSTCVQVGGRDMPISNVPILLRPDESGAGDQNSMEVAARKRATAASPARGLWLHHVILDD